MSSPRAANAFEIVGDHLESPEAQVRRNVATALATIGSAESVHRLVDLAVLDRDASVRGRAFDELLELAAEAGQAAAERASELLFEPSEPASGDGREAESAMEITIRGRANDLLAAFRRQGIGVALPPLPFIDRFALSWKIRRHLMRRPPPPLWRPLLLAFVGALLGAGLNAWWFWTASPELGRYVFLALCLPAAMLSSLLTTATSRTSVPAEAYYDRRMGVLVETVGVLWRPVGKLWQALAVPLIMAVIITAGLVPLKLGFAGLGVRLVDYLAWILLGMLVLALIQMTMRAVSATPSRLGPLGSTVAGGIAGAAFGALAMAGAIWGWTGDASVAIVVSEGLFFLLPLATGFVCERLLSPMVPARRRLSRVEALTPVALVLAVLPGLWLHFNPLTPPQAPPGEPLRQRWWLAKVPVYRQFRVASETPETGQTVCAWIRPAAASDAENLELRLSGAEQAISSWEIPNGRGWSLAPGDYRLEATVANLQVEPSKLSFLVWESYASAVSFLARELLGGLGRDVPPGLVGVFELELVLGAEGGCRR